MTVGKLLGCRVRFSGFAFTPHVCGRGGVALHAGGHGNRYARR